MPGQCPYSTDRALEAQRAEDLPRVSKAGPSLLSQLASHASRTSQAPRVSSLQALVFTSIEWGLGWMIAKLLSSADI